MPRDYALKGTASWAKERLEKAGEEHVLKVGIVTSSGELGTWYGYYRGGRLSLNYFCSFYSDPRPFVGFWPQ